jgi:hypothetical protein
MSARIVDNAFRNSTALWETNEPYRPLPLQEPARAPRMDLRARPDAVAPVLDMIDACLKLNGLEPCVNIPSIGRQQQVLRVGLPSTSGPTSQSMGNHNTE